jgi:hypothetical protein
MNQLAKIFISNNLRNVPMSTYYFIILLLITGFVVFSIWKTYLIVTGMNQNESDESDL